MVHMGSRRGGGMQYGVVEVARKAADPSPTTEQTAVPSIVDGRPFTARSAIALFFLTSSGLNVGPGSFGQGVVPPNTPVRQNALFTDNASPPVVAVFTGNSTPQLIRPVARWANS